MHRIAYRQLHWVLAVLGLVLAHVATARAQGADSSHVLVVEDNGQILVPPEPLPLVDRRLTLLPAGAGGYTTRVSVAGDIPPPGARVDFSGNESGSVRVDLPAPLPFFGELYGDIYVHAQGAISFGTPLPPSSAPSATNSGRLLRDLLVGPPVLAPFWNDLRLGVAGDGRGVYVDRGENEVIVTWYEVTSARPFGGQNTFRVVLSATGRIDIEYGSMASRWGIVGLSPGADRDGVKLTDFATTPAVPRRAAVFAWYRDQPVLNEIALSREVYSRLPDRFQFLTVFTTQPVDGPTPVWSTTVRNEDRGIGMPIFAHSQLFGSRHLEHIVVMNDLSFYADDPRESPRASEYAYAPSTLAVLAHETGHRWLAYAGGIDAALAGDDGHWSYLLDSGASFLGGNALRENPDGSFTSTAAMQSFGPLDRYFMGISAPEEIDPFFVVDDAHGFVPQRSRSGAAFSAASHPERGVTFRGTRRELSISDVIARTGPREPEAGTARTAFRMAMVLVVPAGVKPDQAQIDKLERIRRAFGPFFRHATGNRARMHTWLPQGAATRPVPQDGRLLSGQPRLLDASVRRDSSGRGEVVLDYADFDGDLTLLEVSTDSAPGVSPVVLDVALGTYGNRRGSVSFTMSALPEDASILMLSLIDNRGLRSRALVPLRPLEPTTVAVAS